MKGVILAAGQGSRLHPLTADRPKCMVEIQGKPIVHYIINAYLSSGITEIIVVNGYLGKVLEEYCLSNFPQTQYFGLYISNLCYSHNLYARICIASFYLVICRNCF